MSFLYYNNKVIYIIDITDPNDCTNLPIIMVCILLMAYIIIWCQHFLIIWVAFVISVWIITYCNLDISCLFNIKLFMYCVQLLLNTYNFQRVNIWINIGILIKSYLIIEIEYYYMELFSQLGCYVNYVHYYISPLHYWHLLSIIEFILSNFDGIYKYVVSTS